MAITAQTIGGRSLASLSASLVQLSGWHDGPALQRAATAIPQMLGAALSPMASAQSRQVRATYRIQSATLDARKTNVAIFTDAIAGLVPISFYDMPTIQMRALAGPVTITELAPDQHFTLFDVLLTTTWLVPGGVAYDIEPVIKKFTTTAGVVKPGTVASPGVILVTGALSAFSARTITYRSFNGIAYGTLTVTPPSGESLGANDYLEVSLLHRTIIKVTSAGVRTSVYHWKSAGRFFAPEPADCDRERDAYPTLDISSGEAVYIYRPAWAL